MFGFFGGGAPAEPDYTLSTAELNEMQKKYTELQEAHTRELQAIHGKLVQENDALKGKLRSTEDELKLYKAGRKEDWTELDKLRKEIKGLRGGDIDGGALAVAILDFELDAFTPTLFHQPAQSGRHAAKALRDKIRASLPKELEGSVVNIMILVFLNRKNLLMPDLIAEGLISSPKQLELFIADFNSRDPLCMIVDTTDPKDITLQRMRALATIFTRFSQCRRLVLGRWAFDLELMEMVSPSRLKQDDDDPKKKPKFDDKIRFVEPFPGTFITPHFRSRAPQIVDMRGVLRRLRLRRGRAQLGTPQFNFGKGFHEQQPPICLDHYLLPGRCPREICDFCHTYPLTPGLVDELRHQIADSPCAVVLEGYPCPHGEECMFAHECPRGIRCRRHGCDFGPHMHPLLPPQPQPQPQPNPGPEQSKPAPSKPAPRSSHQSAASGGGWKEMEQALESLQGSPRPRPAASTSPANPNSKPTPPLAPPFSVARGPGSLAARAAARLVHPPTNVPLIPIPDIKSPKSAKSAAPTAPPLVAVSPRQPPSSPDRVASWVEGVNSPLMDPHTRLAADPNVDPFDAEFGGELGGSPVGGQSQQGGQMGGGGAGNELEEMTNEQFEAYRLQLEKEEAELEKGMGGEAGGAGLDHDRGGYGEGSSKGKAESVLFGIEGGNPAPKGKKDPFAGRKGGRAV